MLFGGVASGFYIDSLLFPDVHSNIIFHIISFIFGVIVLQLVIKISKNTGRTLAKYGRKGELARMQTNVLAKEGVYKYMRHPMHLGLFLFPVAFSFIVGSPSFILIISPLEVLFMLIMIEFVEEPQAISKFGDMYLEYKKHTPMFCFKPECIKELLKGVEKNK